MPVASSWKAIGRGLRIDSGRLDTIQESCDKKPKECLSEVLTCWLKRNYNVERFGEPTWRAVVKVVAHPAGGDSCALALSIARKKQTGNNIISKHRVCMDLLVNSHGIATTTCMYKYIFLHGITLCL